MARPLRFLDAGLWYHVTNRCHTGRTTSLETRMTSLERLLKRQAALKRAINAHLDLLIGTVNKTPAQSGWYLTAKVDGAKGEGSVFRHLEQVQREARHLLPDRPAAEDPRVRVGRHADGGSYPAG